MTSKINDLEFDLMLLMIIFALANNAFKINYQTMKDVYVFHVKPPRHNLIMRFKTEILIIFIFWPGHYY